MHIPNTADEAVAQLTGLGILAMATDWERAAVVYALTEPSQGRRTDLSGNPEKFTYAGLAEKGVPGLTNKDTVAHYYESWAAGMEDGYAEPAALGADVVIPDPKVHPFPPNRTVGRFMDDERRQRLMDAGQAEGMRTGSKVVDVVSNVKSVIAGIKADPDFARTIMEDINATVALQRAENDTERARDHRRTMQRGANTRAAAAEDAGPQVLRPGLRFIGAFFDFDAFIYGVVQDYARDDEGAQVARDLADMLDRRALQLRAWADGQYEEQSNEEFEEGLRALLGDDA